MKNKIYIICVLVLIFFLTVSCKVNNSENTENQSENIEKQLDITSNGVSFSYEDYEKNFFCKYLVYNQGYRITFKLDDINLHTESRTIVNSNGKTVYSKNYDYDNYDTYEFYTSFKKYRIYTIYIKIDDSMKNENEEIEDLLIKVNINDKYTFSRKIKCYKDIPFDFFDISNKNLKSYLFENDKISDPFVYDRVSGDTGIIGIWKPAKTNSEYPFCDSIEFKDDGTYVRKTYVKSNSNQRWDTKNGYYTLYILNNEYLVSFSKTVYYGDNNLEGDIFNVDDNELKLFDVSGPGYFKILLEDHWEYW